MELAESLPFLWILWIVIWIFVIRYWKKKRKVCTESAEAKIIKIEKDLDSDWQESRTPIRGFTVDWKEYTWKLTIAVQHKTPHVWDKRMILYNPKNPKDFIDWNWGAHTTIWVWLIIIWIGLIVAAFLDM